MNNIVHLTDNNTQGTSIPRESIQDVLQISNIGRLQNAPDLLVFPHSFSEVKDGIGDVKIVKFISPNLEYPIFKHLKKYPPEGSLVILLFP